MTALAQNNLQRDVIDLCRDPRFRHHLWYVDHHLIIVEQMAFELCDHYPAADRTIVHALVWLHDIGKIVNHDRAPHAAEMKQTAATAQRLLSQHGYPPAMTRRILADLDVFDRHATLDIAAQNIETRIVSAADGCAHLVGPFFPLYWYENPSIPIDEHISAGIKKAQTDWHNKVTLPEARAAFAARHRAVLENDPQHRPPRYFI